MSSVISLKPSGLRPGLSRLCAGLAGLGLLLAGSLYVAVLRDDAVLREQAETVTRDLASTEAKLAALNDWVYHNQGFKKNDQYFLWSRLGPTPNQVLASGGDCADKSRLLSRMLTQIGIESSLVMQYPCEGCEPVHTVVYARTGARITPADPVYNITFPDGQGGLLDIHTLKANKQLLNDRLTQLVAERGAQDKIAFYDAPTHHFEHATTLNWDKNAVLRGVAGLLRLAGYEPSLVFRPQFLEHPKLALSLASLLAGLGFGLMAWLLRARRR